MGLSTYSALKTAISDHLDRSDLSDFVDDFIDLAEARHKNEIRFRDMIKRSQATASTRYLALPSDFLEMQTLRLLTDPVRVLQQLTFHEMNRQRVETTGKPKYFTVHEEIEFEKAPDDDYTAEMIYYAELTALSDSNTSNALLSRAPNCYLYGALLAATPFLGEDERIPVWEQQYVIARDGLIAADKRGRHMGPLFSKVAGPTP